MATTFNQSTTYAGKVAGGYIRQAFLANDSLQNITIRENVEYKEVVRKLVDDITFEAPTCNFTDSGTITTSERVLTLKEFQVNRSVCRREFLDDWNPKSVQDGGMNLDFNEALIQNMLAGISARNEVVLWSGTASTTEYDGFATLFEAVGSGVNMVSTPVAIDKTNVLTKIENLIDSCPLKVRRATERPKIYVASNVAEAYRRKQADLGNGYFFQSGQEVKMTWIGTYEIVECPGMPSSMMAMAQKSNLWFGTNTLSQWNEVFTLDMKKLDGSNNVRYGATFFAGAQFGFGNEISAYIL
ncbi:hypothetical protein UFOVP386_19 [uncultured Caudovirales phage]|uniref:Uncharacterized protein n=1 Tax=uncultured Caudovirales phage TaxID=2100421 RepID=A0A6J7X1F4_9CAUD|nr:hypothetical protein UFOVP386_19 [uncultured Caudovirales phage]